MITYLLFLVARPLATRLPIPFLAAVGVLAGYLGYVFGRSMRQALLANLAVARPELGEGARRRLALRACVHGAWGYIELLGMQRLTPDAIRAAYPLWGLEHLEDALRQGKGAILVSGHIGPMSVAGQLLAAHGIRTTVVVEPIEPPKLFQLVAGLRGGFGLRLIALGRTTVREILAALRRGETVGFAADRDVAGTGEPFPFFKATTRMTTAPATIARRTGAAVLPCVSYRSGLWRGHAVIDPPIKLPRTSDSTADVHAGTRRIITSLERYIAAHPDQWMAFTPIWTSEC